MKTIFEKNNLANVFLGKQALKSNTEYRLLHFCHLKEVDGVFVLYNNLTKEMVELESNEVNFINSLPTSNIEGFEYFAENWYIVPVENDDCALSDQLHFLNDTYQEKGFINSYVILTTTDCNARCFYCYENGITKHHMSEETASDVADYIIKNSKGHDVHIKWFGGEPLYNAPVMDIICDKLTENNVKFRGNITTNGYLFNIENVEKAVEKWNITHVQISLDGTEEKYNRIKNFIHKEGSAFKIVTDNIENLLKNNIGVSIRLNVSDINREDMYNLIDYLHERYGSYKKASVYCANLFDLDGTRVDSEHKRLNEEFYKMDTFLTDLGMRQNNLNKWRSFERGCMAQKTTSVCISPKGLLSRCEHFSEGERMYGSIYSDEINAKAYDYWMEFERIPECKTCVAYPSCYGITNCPNVSNKCSIASMPIKRYNLGQAIAREYRKWKAGEEK